MSESELQSLINQLDANFERQLTRLKKSVKELSVLAEKLESGEGARESLPKS